MACALLTDPSLNKIATANPNRAAVIRSNDEVGINFEGARRAPQQVPLPVRVPKSLGSFIAGFKASVTSRAKRELTMPGIWQRNYFEHIARKEAEIKGFWDYIDDNPRKWEEDQLHPSSPPNKFTRG